MPVDIDASLERFHHQRVDLRPWGWMCKTPEDLERYEAVLGEVQPHALIETGTWNGCSARWFADRVEHVLTIDNVDLAIAGVLDHPNIERIVGDSADEQTTQAVRIWVERQRFGPVMVVLDSDHSGQHVMREMVSYAPLVTVGSFLVVEDTLVRWMPGQCGYHGSPMDAVEAFLQTIEYLGDDAGGHFENDDTIENMSTTSQFPGGWLRRVA